MEKPPFEKITAQRIDEFLRKFFVEHLGHARIENDPDAKEPQASDAWRMVIPEDKARPFAVAWQHGLSAMERRQVSSLYIKRVILHRDSSNTTAPALYGFTDGLRLVLFSADPARNRDDRFDVTEETWEFATVREKLKLLHHDQLQFQKRLGRKTPQVEFLFQANHLSADDKFRRYVHTVREELMRTVIDEKKALTSVVYHLLETPEDRDSGTTRYVGKDQRLKKDFEALYLEVGMRLGDAIAAAVDTLLLRYVMIRFIEAYHPEAMNGLLTNAEVLKRGNAKRKVTSASSQASLLVAASGLATSTFSETELEIAESLGRSLAIDVAKAKRKAKGVDAMLFDLYSFDDAKAGAEAVLSEEEKREQRFGGDFYLADLGRAARAIEETLLAKPSSRGSKLLQDFLSRTGNPGLAHWEFRYEDLRPQTLQDYYESSLGTAVQLTWNKLTDSFQIEVGRSQRQRKELGAYYTDARLCRFMVERTVKPLFEQRLTALQKAISAAKLDDARQAFESLVTLSICDPTMGSAPFLRSAFDYLSEQFLPFYRTVSEAAETLPKFYEEVSRQYPFCGAKGGTMDEDGVGRWEWHILRRMLYGVDIDLKAVCIACQTFALSALKYLRQGERFPSFFNLNLKIGNALISPVKPADRAKLAKDHGKTISQLIKLRKEAMTLPNDAKSYDKLAALLRRVDEVKNPILQELIEDRVALILEDFTEELRPLCWELEFPEVFFTPDGELKSNAGFDVIIGNPPWDAIKFNDNEFLGSIGAVAEDTIERLTARHSGIAKAYQRYRDMLDKWKLWVSEGRQYEHQQGGRDRNKWRLTTEVAWKLTSPQGAMSLVVPGGIIADEGGFALKQWIFPQGEAGPFISFEEANGVFSGTQGFTIFDFRKGSATRTLQHLEGLTDAGELSDWPYTPIALPLELVRKMSPEALAIPSVQDETDGSILKKLYQHPLINDVTSPWYAETVSYDYHMAHGREAFRRGGKIPLLEGKSIEQYETAQLNGIEKRVASRTQSEPRGQYRIACADVAGTLLARRMLCTIIPHGYATGDKLNCLLVGGDNVERLFLVGILNSFVIEWRVRQLARSNNIKKFMLIQIPVVRPPKPDVERVASLVAALVTADERFDDLRPLLKGLKPVTQEGQRLEFKCRIDAEVARLYGLTESELDRVLEGFSKVPQETKELVRQEFSKLSSEKRAA